MEDVAGPVSQGPVLDSVREEVIALIAREKYRAAYACLERVRSDGGDGQQMAQLHNLMLLCRNCARLGEDAHDMRAAAARAAEQQRKQRQVLLEMLERMERGADLRLAEGSRDRPVRRLRKIGRALWDLLQWPGPLSRVQVDEVTLVEEREPHEKEKSAATPLPASPTSDFDTDLQIWGLGQFCVLYGLREVERWRSHISRSIFQYLLLNHPHPVPSELLMETFWPEEDPDSARHRLHQAIYLLRRSLDNQGGNNAFVIHDGSGYLIDPELTLFVDFAQLEEHFARGRQRQRQGNLGRAADEWRRVVELHQGILFPEERYAEWPALRREQIRQKYLEALDRLSHYHLQEGPLPRAIGYCRQLLEADSCREDVHRRLMFAYWKQGHRHLALQQYEQCVATLEKELEVPPMPATVELFEKVRDQSPS